MTFERRAYREHIAAAAHEKAIDVDAHHLRVLERAALEAHAVTGDPRWDHYLSYLQSAIEETEAQSLSLREKLCGGDIVGHDEMMRIKLALAECNGRCTAWKVARDLPKELIANGDKARDLLAQIEAATP